MSNLRICGANAVDDERCVLACSVADVLDVENLQNRQRGKILRVAAGSGITVTGTYGGEAVRASFMSMLRHNMTSDGTFRWQGYSDAAWTTQVIDTGTRDAVPTALLGELDFGIDELGYNIFSPTYRAKRSTVFFDDADMAAFSTEVILSWKLTLTDPDNPSLFIDLSRLWVGDYFELDDNPVYGAAMGWIDESSSWRTDAGGHRTDAALPYRGGKFDAQYLPETDRARWMELSEFCGAGRRSFFCSWFPDNAVPKLTRDHEGEFVFKNPLPQLSHTEAEGGARFNTSVNLEEV